MKSIFYSSTLIAALLLSSTVLAKSHRTINEKRQLRSSGTLYVSNISGSVRITGSDEEMMVLEGSIGEGVDRVEVTGEGDTVRIRVETRRGSHGDSEAELLIRVPRNARIDVSCVSCDVDIKDATGVADISTVSGEIEINGELKTIELKSVSGDIRVRAVGERLEAKSVSGDVRVEVAIGEVELETVSGDMFVGSGRVSRFRAKSVSGDVELHTEITGSGTSDIESHSGDVLLVLGPRTDATFDVHTFSGEIRGRGDDKTRDRFSLGSGSARVSINTFSGDVQVRTP